MGIPVVDCLRGVPGRTYTLPAGTDLIEFPETVTSFSVVEEELDRTIVDPNAIAPRKFYRLEIVR